MRTLRPVSPKAAEDPVPRYPRIYAELQAAIDEIGTTSPSLLATLQARMAADVAASHVFSAQGMTAGPAL
jgi:hypothetical protein